MRRSSANDPQWVLDKNQQLVGIALGSDFCAEHEWGTSGMKYAFRCDESLDGIERRRIRQVSANLRLVNGSALFFCPVQSYYKAPEEWLKDELRQYRGEKLVCAWDQDTFGIACYTPEDKAHLQTLWEAFKAKDIAFWTNIGPFHLGGGLIFAIVSQVPQADQDAMLETDLDNKRLEAAAEATGIAKALKAAQRGYYALSPQWADESKTKIRFWLNPMDQSDNNAGWYSIENLKLWIDGKGPIPKGAKK